MEQPGFFDRMKTRFTQNAAGTTDLSNLTEEQQKLLRRQFIGRLGSSLAQTGDFGAGMEAQAEAAKGMQAQMQAEALRRQRAGYFDGPSALNPDQGALVQPGGVAPPAAPRLLNPASTNPQPGVPAAQAPAQAASPAVQQSVPPREQFVGAIQRAVRKNDLEYAESLRKQVDTLFPMEKFTAKDMVDASGRRVVGMVGDQGTTRSTDYSPMPVARTQELQDLADPELFARRLAIENASATRVSTTLMPGETEQQKLDANFLYGSGGLREQALGAQQTLATLGNLESVLNSADTGATQEVLARIGTFFGTEAGADLQATKQSLGPIILANIKQLGVNPSNADLTFLQAGMPGFGSDARANAVGLRLLRQAAEARFQTFREAEKFYHGNNRSLTGYEGYITPVNTQNAGGVSAAGGAIPRFGTPEFEAWARSQQGGGR